ncbi:hypothetical protein F4827_003904 [Paraburkholderia bannensis]|uniref:Uncharacterized protein n=1 Tax=Paraburkholderia bannensis TaxID=765414 RepID=A0A7W9U184_9BURK|nr:hypothetical protein [Paraburkholderia sp. WP4_3_2]MBB6104045.1 hypothetical protein [Paraburkholderia bannensis]
MPSAAFADRWATIKAGRSWSALAKNRRKNGDFYRVRANVTPIVERGATVGYLSVRTKPSRDEVRDTEALYAERRNGIAANRFLIHGEVRRRGMGGMFDAMMRLAGGKQSVLVSVAGMSVPLLAGLLFSEPMHGCSPEGSVRSPYQCLRVPSQSGDARAVDEASPDAV